MTVDELAQVTATIATGPKGEKTFHKILRGCQGKFGIQLLIDVDELNKALELGAYTFQGKDGHKIVALSPKVWPKKEAKQAKFEIPFD